MRHGALRHLQVNHLPANLRVVCLLPRAARCQSQSCVYPVILEAAAAGCSGHQPAMFPAMQLPFLHKTRVVAKSRAPNRLVGCWVASSVTAVCLTATCRSRAGQRWPGETARCFPGGWCVEVVATGDTCRRAKVGGAMPSSAGVWRHSSARRPCQPASPPDPQRRASCDAAQKSTGRCRWASHWPQCLSNTGPQAGRATSP